MIKQKITKQEAWERELKEKASKGELRGQQTLMSEVSTSRRLSEFGYDPKTSTSKKYGMLVNYISGDKHERQIIIPAKNKTDAVNSFYRQYPDGYVWKDSIVEMTKKRLEMIEDEKELTKRYESGTLAIKGDKPKLARLARHLQKEHPSTKGKMALFDPKKFKMEQDYGGFLVSFSYNPYLIELIKQMDGKWNPRLKMWFVPQIWEGELIDISKGNYPSWFKSKRTLAQIEAEQKRGYDPIKLVQGIPARWYEAMVNGIKKRSDVRNPYAIVKGIWARLPAHTRNDIIKREKAGERFHYDLPLPDDRQTRGIGTLRMVKPFNLAEAQVNVSKKDMDAVKKSGIFRPMKREDGSICQVARCKGARPVNIFVDEV